MRDGRQRTTAVRAQLSRVLALFLAYANAVAAHLRSFGRRVAARIERASSESGATVVSAWRNWTASDRTRTGELLTSAALRLRATMEEHPPASVARAVAVGARRRARLSHRPRTRDEVVRLIAGMATAMLLAAVTVIALAGLFALDRYHAYAKSVVPPEELLSKLPGGGARVYDREGRLLYQFVDEYGGLRRPVPLAEISPWLLEATISTEDADFYENNGLNMRGLARAGVENFTPFHGVGVLEGTGGSSITQQLAKNVYIPRDERYERTVTRKLKEVVIALELTKRYPKEKILEWYLNSISYGGLYIGVEAAADGYFQKPAKDLTLAEAAMLAGIPQSPVAYDPFLNPEGAKARQQQVLTLMVRHGAISEAEAAAATAERLAFRTTKKRFDIRAPHFVLGPVTQEVAARFGERAILEDGLEITTTLDLDLQDLATAALEKHLRESEQVAGGHNGAVEIIDPRTGQVLAYVGSRDYFREDIEGNNDMAQALRSPGSTLKPFTYLSAFQRGWTPGTNILDVKTEIVDAASGKVFSPKNPNNRYNGLLTAAATLGNSLNVGAMKAIMFAGVPQTVSLLRQAGFTTLDDPRGYGPALTLGGADITLADETFAYAALANGGVMRGQPAVVPHDPGERRLDPVILLRVTSARGWTYEAAGPEEVRVAQESLTYLVTSMISDPKNTCIVWACGALEVAGRPTAHKTGTSAPFENTETLIGDTWSFGYTPDLVVGVWIGNADKKPMQNIYSTTIAWPTWRDIIDQASKHLDLPPKPFARPATVQEATLCWPSGFVASSLCPSDRRYRGLVATDVKPLQDTWWQRVGADGAVVSAAGVGALEVRLVLPAAESALREWLITQGGGWFLLGGAGRSSAAGPGTVAITSPAGGQVVSGTVAVQGRADTPNILWVMLEYGAGTSPSAWIPIQASTRGVSGTLGTWDTGNLPAGEYTLRLRAADQKLGELSTVSVVQVGGRGGGGAAVSNSPQVSLSPALSGVFAAGTVIPVQGAVTSSDLAEFIVEVQVGGSWSVIGRGTSPVSGVLTQWNTAGMAEGAYTVRVTARNRSGAVAIATAAPRLQRSASGAGPTSSATPTASGSPAP